MRISWRNIWHVVIGFLGLILATGLLTDFRFFISPIIGEAIYGKVQYNSSLPFAKGSIVWLVEDWAVVAIVAFLMGFLLNYFINNWTRGETIILAILFSLSYPIPIFVSEMLIALDFAQLWHVSLLVYAEIIAIALINIITIFCLIFAGRFFASRPTKTKVIENG